MLGQPARLDQGFCESAGSDWHAGMHFLPWLLEASVTRTASCLPQPLLRHSCFVHDQQFMRMSLPVRRNLRFVCSGVLSQSFPFAPCLRPCSCCPLLVFRYHLLPVLCRLFALLSRVWFCAFLKFISKYRYIEGDRDYVKWKLQTWKYGNTSCTSVYMFFFLWQRFYNNLGMLAYNRVNKWNNRIYSDIGKKMVQLGRRKC